MAFNSAVSSFTIATASGVGTTYTVTAGFEPKAGIVFWTGRGDTADAVSQGNERRGFGFFTSTTNRYCAATTSMDNTGAASASQGAHNAAVVATVLADNSTFDGLLDVDAILSDGVRFIIDDQFPADLTIGVMLFGGTDITNATVVEFNIGTGTGTVDITSVGFQGDVLFVTGNDSIANAPTADGTRAELYFGACTSTTDEHVWFGGTDQGSANADTGSYSYAGEVIAHAGGAIGSPGSLINRSEFSSWLSNGFQLNRLETGRNGVRGYALVIKGGKWIIGDFSTLTTTGTISESGFGFTPEGVLVVSNQNIQSTQDAFVDDDKLSIGAAAGSTQHAQAVWDEDSKPNMEVDTAIDFDKVYINISSSTPSIDGLISVQSFGSDGITFSQDDADTTANFAWYIACGEIITGGGTNYSFSGTIAGVGVTSVVAPALAVAHSLISTIANISAMSGDIPVAHTLQGDIVGTSTLTDQLFITKPITGNITGLSTTTSTNLLVAHALEGTCAGLAILSAQLAVSHTLQGTIAGTSDLTAVCRAQWVLFSSIDGVATFTGSLSVSRPLAGQIVGQSTTNDTDYLAVHHALQGICVGTSSLIGDAVVTIRLTGNIAGVSTLTDLATVHHPLAGSIVGTSVFVDAQLDRAQFLTGNIIASSSLTGSLTVAHSLESNIVGVSSVFDSYFVVAHSLRGNIVGTSALSANLVVIYSLNGTIIGTSDVRDSFITVYHSLQGIIVGTAFVNDTDYLTVHHPLQGLIAGDGTFSGETDRNRGILGAINGTSTLTGTLTVDSPPAQNTRIYYYSQLTRPYGVF